MRLLPGPHTSKEEVMNKWWGYIHINGKIQVKRYFSEMDIEDAEESPFVSKVFRPFDAKDPGDAIKQIKERMRYGKEGS